MKSKGDSFADVVDRIDKVNALRDTVIMHGFTVLEARNPSFAHMLIQQFGDRRKAARWMCIPQRAFDGQSAYQLLADGEPDRVWSRIIGETPDAAPLRMVQG